MVYEDGLGWPDTNAYITRTDFTAYLSDVGFDYSGYSSEQIDSAIVRATALIDTYRRWPGVRASAMQGLEWPRVGAYDVNGYLLEGVPVAIRKATMEAAKQELISPGYFTAYERATAREKIGEIEVEYSGGEIYKAIDQYVKKIVPIGGVRFVR